MLRVNIIKQKESGNRTKLRINRKLAIIIGATALACTSLGLYFGHRGATAMYQPKLEGLIQQFNETEHKRSDAEWMNDVLKEENEKLRKELEECRKRGCEKQRMILRPLAEAAIGTERARL